MDKNNIDIIQLVKVIVKEKKTIFRIVSCFFLIGLFVAVFSESNFEASSTFIPQISKTNKVGGNLGGLASLAGINLDGDGDGNSIPPGLYPKIVNSTYFGLALMEAPLTVDGKSEKVVYRDFYENYYMPSLVQRVKKYTIGLPTLLIGLISKVSPVNENKSKNHDFVQMTDMEMKHFDRLRSQINIEPNSKEGFVKLTFKMPSPLMAAEMARFAEQLLQNQLIIYKIENAQTQLDFTQERLLDKKKEFEISQDELARFKDRNLGLNSALSQNYLQRLQTRYDLTLGVYSELMKQLEQAKLQVSKDTPIFSVIQPVTIPARKSEPRRSIIIAVSIIAGLLLALLFIVLKETLGILRVQLTKTV
tara:strand:- start:576 stop:1661 length:1086 start_codon:yes stop_codon:yes gene_type:complete